MKNKKIQYGVLAIALALAAFSGVSAQGAGVKAETSTKVQAGKSTSVQTQTTTTTTAESDQSNVATVVQELLEAADREKGIGAEVRIVAQEQKESNEKVAEAKAKIEKRSKIKTFLFGSDYKNIGVLRSEMVKTDAQTDKLERLVEKASTPEVKTTLTTQIGVLEKIQLSIQSFIELHKESFSLFGWLAKKD